jgi:hypothetical protein
MREKGQLILVMSIVLFLLILGGIILSVIPPENFIARRQIESTQALYIAQAGLQNGVYLINNNPNLSKLELSSQKNNYYLNVTYTITETSGAKIINSYTLPVSLGEFFVTATYSSALINEGNLLSQGDFFVIKSIGYVPYKGSSNSKRSIEIVGRTDEISLDPFKYAVFAGTSVNVKGNAGVFGESLEGGGFDTAIYSRGDVNYLGSSIINTSTPIPGVDYIENDTTLQMPRLNEEYLKSISQSQGLYRSGSVNLKDLVDIIMSNPNWYNSATGSYNTWSLVIYVDGSAQIASNIDFQGTIVIKGDFKIRGTGKEDIKIRGLVYSASFNAVDEELTIYGNPIVEGATLGEIVDIGGNSTVRHNKLFLNNIFNTHGIENIVQKTRGKLKILSWKEF